MTRLFEIGSNFYFLVVFFFASTRTCTMFHLFFPCIHNFLSLLSGDVASRISARFSGAQFFHRVALSWLFYFILCTHGRDSSVCQAACARARSHLEIDDAHVLVGEARRHAVAGAVPAHLEDAAAAAIPTQQLAISHRPVVTSDRPHSSPHCTHDTHQMFSDLSNEPDARYWPSGENATEYTGSTCLASVATHFCASACAAQRQAARYYAPYLDPKVSQSRRTMHSPTTVALRVVVRYVCARVLKPTRTPQYLMDCVYQHHTVPIE
jgi:hypothetical protein